MYVKYVNSFDLSLPNQCQIGMFNLIKAWSFWLPFSFIYPFWLNDQLTPSQK
jgi:hypothetical protein